MAFGSTGASGTGVSSTSGSSWTLTTTGNSFNASSFRFGILRVCVDNLSTSDGATNDVTSVTGGTGTWTKLGEYTNGNASAAAGVTVALFLFMPSGNNAVGTVFTINLSGNAVDKTAQFYIHTHASGQSVQKAGSETGGATDASNNFASVAIAGLSSKEYLFAAVHGKEANTTTSITVSGSFTTSGGTLRSRNNVDAVALCGEFRILTGTGATSNPTLAVSGDAASLIVALEEYTPSSGTTHTVSAGVKNYGGQSIATIRATVHAVGVGSMAYGGQVIASGSGTTHTVGAAAMTYTGQAVATIRATVHAVTAALKNYAGQSVASIKATSHAVGLALKRYAGQDIDGAGEGAAPADANAPGRYGKYFGYKR